METEELVECNTDSDTKKEMGEGNLHKANVKLMCLVGRGELFKAEEAVREIGRELTVKELLNIAKACYRNRDQEVADVAFDKAEKASKTKEDLLNVAAAYREVGNMVKFNDFLLKAAITSS